MTQRQIYVVKRSWKIIGKINPALVGDVFYSKLFLMNPEMRQLFRMNQEDQAKKLIDMLTVIVTGLDRMDALIGELEQLAIRHKQYGVSNWQYAKVGEVLEWTLENALGRDFDAETREAWNLCYTRIAEVMIQAVNRS